MGIKNKFLHFNTKAGFLSEISKYVTYNEANNSYIVKPEKTDDWNMFKNWTCFIKDTQEIWTHEQFYKGDVNADEIDKEYATKSEINSEINRAINKENALEQEIKHLDSTKADIDDLSNIIAEDVIDEVTFPDVNDITREELKKDLFIDLWNTACGTYGKYNPETGYFELNEILDIDYAEALKIYVQSSKLRNQLYTGTGTGIPKIAELTLRTVMPVNLAGGAYTISLNGYAQDNSKIQTLLILGLNSNNRYVNGWSYAFYNCLYLRKILGVIRMYDSTSNVISDRSFANCIRLEEIQLYYCNANMNFQNCSSLSFDSFNYMVSNSKSTASFTITVYKKIYAALTGEAESYPFNGGTQEQWQQLLIDATERNITFATV